MSQKNPQIFFCELCNYTTSNKKDYNKHILTRKHQNRIKLNEKSPKIPEPKKQKIECKFCGKAFGARNSLWYHNKKCNVDTEYHNNKCNVDTENVQNEPIENINSDAFFELLKQNQEFKQLLVEQQEDNQKLQTQLIEVVKEGKTVNSHNTTNNKFNLNFFLNEQCKNAMNISEFINNIVLSVEDLKTTGKLGYIDGISKIFAEKLRELDTYERPMHCTDLKRETLYIKNNNKWSKDTEDKRKIKTAIECVANKNLNNLDAWKEENPNHVVMDSKEDKEFVEIMTNSLGGMGSDREKNKQKIIKNVLKEITVEK